MGIDVQALKLLCSAKEHGLSVRSTLMIGRQELCLPAAALRRTLRRFGRQISPQQAEDVLTEADGYADGLFRLLGAERVESLDASPFEGASLVHDLNDPIPDDWASTFDLVYDGGSLEHVFNLPTALRNCMQVLREGGHYLGIHPANGYGGHGFYQFSPELYFRVFAEENGFRLLRVVLFRPGGRHWHEVADPAAVACRVAVPDRRQVLLGVCAVKTRRTAVFSVWPQQSDYSAKWSKHDGLSGIRQPRAARPSWQRAVRSLKTIFPRPLRRKFYRRVRV